MPDYIDIQENRIERRDYSAADFSATKGEAAKGRISPTSLRRTGQARLRASGSTGQHIMGGKSMPFARLVTGFGGCVDRLEDVRCRPAVWPNESQKAGRRRMLP